MVDASKGVDTPFQGDWQSVLGLILVVVVGMVANTAGVGGGAIFVPLFQALVGFPLKPSTALSQALITAGAAVSLALQVFGASPVEPSKPLIDFSMVLLLLPVLLVGVGLGVLLNVILPAYLISILLFLLMCLLITQSVNKGVSMWRAETRKHAQQAEQALAAAAAAGPVSTVGLSLSVHKEEEGEGEEEGGTGPRGAQGQQQRSASVHASLHGASVHGSSSTVSESRYAADQRSVTDDAEVPNGWQVADTGTPLSADAAAFPSAAAGAAYASRRPSAASAAATAAATAAANGGPPPTASAGMARQDWRSFRPPQVALPAVAPDGSDSWFSRRNAWLVHFMQAGNELGVEEVAGAHAWGVNGDVCAPTPGESRGGRRRGGGVHRTFSLPFDGLTDPLLSAEDSAAARVPHGHKRLPPELWDLSAGRTEEELLQALSDDLGGAPAAAAAAGGADAARGIPAWHSAQAVLPSGGDGRPLSADGAAGYGAEELLGRRGGEEIWPISSSEGGGGQQALMSGSGSRAASATGGSAVVRRASAAARSAADTPLGSADGQDYADPRTAAASAGLGSGSGDGDAAVDGGQAGSKSAPPSSSSRPRGRRAWVATCRGYMRDGWGRLPKALLLIMLGCWGTYVALQLVRSMSRTCSGTYWGLFAAQLVLMPLFSLAASVWMERQRKAQQQVHELEMVCMEEEEAAAAMRKVHEQNKGMAAVRSKLRTWSSWLMYQGLALAAGVIGGLLGLGGGMIIGPVLLEMGVHPQVSSATSSTMVLFSSSTALISLAALGMLNPSYAAAFSVASMVASVLGVMVIGGAIRRTGRVSLVVLALAAVMLIGGLAVGGFGITIIMDAVKTGNLGTLPLCPA